MKIVYIANIRLPTEKAHGIQIMKMCEAFARIGAEVELVVPTRHNAIIEDPFDYYGVERIFTITTLSTPDLVKWGRAGFLIQAIRFVRIARRYLRQAKPDIVYSRDKVVLLLLPKTAPFVWEIHTEESRFVASILGKRAKAIVTITSSLAALCNSFGIPREKIIVEHDGVDLEQFSVSISQKEAQHKLGLPLDTRLVLYTGHLYAHKGADILAQAAKLFADNVCAVIVGGTEADLKRFRTAYGDIKNLIIVGQRPHTDIPYYLKAADVLVLPNSATSEASRLHTSPMKLFEYMASGVPISASDVPSLREIIDESMANFFTPDDPAALAVSILSVLSNEHDAREKARHAQKKVEEYTWNRRAKTVLDFIKAQS
jgi:glycosyltransferase involved in cell wall biosynthesis